MEFCITPYKQVCTPPPSTTVDILVYPKPCAQNAGFSCPFLVLNPSSGRVRIVIIDEAVDSNSSPGGPKPCFCSRVSTITAPREGLNHAFARGCRPKTASGSARTRPREASKEHLDQIPGKWAPNTVSSIVLEHFWAGGQKPRNPARAPGFRDTHPGWNLGASAALNPKRV